MMIVVLVGILVTAAAVLPVAGRGRSLVQVFPGHQPPKSVGWRHWAWHRTRRDGALASVVVAHVAAYLRAGATPAAAWNRATGVQVDDLGIPDHTELASYVGGEAHASTVVAACRLAAEIGSPLSGVLEDIAAVMSAEQQASSQRDAAFAGPRATIRLLTWLPIAGMVGGSLFGAAPWAVLASGGIGTVSLLLGVGMWVAGHGWARRLLRVAEVDHR